MALQGPDNLRLARNDRLAELDQSFNPVMVGVVSSIPTGGNFILVEIF